MLTKLPRGQSVTALSRGLEKSVEMVAEREGEVMGELNLAPCWRCGEDRCSLIDNSEKDGETMLGVFCNAGCDYMTPDHFHSYKELEKFWNARATEASLLMALQCLLNVPVTWVPGHKAEVNAAMANAHAAVAKAEDGGRGYG